MLPASHPLYSPPLPSTILGFCFSEYLLSTTFYHTAPPPPQQMYPCTASIHPPTVPFSASSSSYVLLTLSLYSTIIILSSLHSHLWSHCPLLLPLLHVDLKDDRFVLCGDILSRQRVQSFTLLSCCCRTTSRSSSVLCRPLLLVIVWLSFLWEKVSATANPFLLNISTSFALPCSLFPIQSFLCFRRPLAQPFRCVH